MMSKSHKQRERRLEAARGYQMLGMHDHALRELDAIADSGRSAEVALLRGESFREKQNYPAALKAYGRALADSPDNLTVLMGMAWCYKRTGQLPRSIAAMQHAQRTSPDEPIVPYNLACYYALAGEKAQALTSLEHALQMAPDLVKLIPEETDFDPLREDPDFTAVIESRTLQDK